MSKRKLIVIVGPTASGKTGIGVRLAGELSVSFGGGEIVSADSRQVFRGLDIGTGKEYFEDVKQWLIDIVEPPKHHLVGDTYEVMEKDGSGNNSNYRFSVFDWLPLARAAVEDIFNRGKVPIVVGGTGLYVQALIEGFQLESRSSILDGSTSLTTGFRMNREDRIEGSDLTSRIYNLNSMSRQELSKTLKDLDPATWGNVDKQNPHRLKRAIERARQNLKPVKKKPDFDVLQIGVNLPRDELYKRIDDRVEARFRAGMLEEVLGLIKSGVDIDWLIELGLEYRVITKFILANQLSPVISKKLNSANKNDNIQMANVKQKSKGLNDKNLDIKLLNISFDIRNSDFDIDRIAEELRMLPEYEIMKTTLKYKIHAFARRQLIWFRRFPDIVWLDNYSQILAKSKEFLGKIKTVNFFPD